MINDESPRGMNNQPNRKSNFPKYSDKNYTYSPSTNYNYNHGANYSGNGYNGNGYNGQHPRRRNDRYKRETVNSSERIVKQNDLIIKLLKEIRDRLPAPPVTETTSENELSNYENGINETLDSTNEEISDETDVVMEHSESEDEADVVMEQSEPADDSEFDEDDSQASCDEMDEHK